MSRDYDPAGRLGHGHDESDRHAVRIVSILIFISTMLGALRPALRTAVPRAASLRALPLTPLSRAAQPSSSQSRAFSSTPRAQLQNLFEAPETPALAITKLDSRGFLLSDGLLVNGGVVFADGRALLWDVDPPRGDGSQGLAAAWEGWSPERFKVLETLVPRPGE
jgi:hypothetical protein